MGEYDDSLDKLEVGKRIKEIRESNGLTQEQLAEILKVTPNAVRAYEKGKYGISKDVMNRFRQNFHVTADYLLFGYYTDEDELLGMVENASEESKMKILTRLMIYFVVGKKRSYKADISWDSTAGKFKEIFGDMLK